MSTADVHVRLAADLSEWRRAHRAAARDLERLLAPVRAAKQAHRARTRARKTAYHHRRR